MSPSALFSFKRAARQLAHHMPLQHATAEMHKLKKKKKSVPDEPIVSFAKPQKQSELYIEITSWARKS